jgi:hypothetical protein
MEKSPMSYKACVPQLFRLFAAVAVFSGPALAQNAYHFPQFADGGGYVTRFYVQNTSTSAINATLSFWSDSGNPVTLTIGDETALSFAFSIPANGTKILTTSGRGADTVVGGAVLRTDSLADILANATFRYAPGGVLATEIGVPPSLLSDSYTMPAIDDDATQLGLAVANPNSTELAVTLSLIGEGGTPTGRTAVVALPKRGHRAVYLWQLFEGIRPFHGSCQVTAPAPFALLALTQSGSIYSSIPSTPRIAALNFGTGSFALSSMTRGINYWYPGHPDLLTTATEIRRVGIQVVRYGGGAVDSSSQFLPSEHKLDGLVSYCRSIRAEPWVQVSLVLGTPDQAAAFVRYCNIDNNYNIKLWSIGNEPDLYGGNYSVDNYIRDYRRFATAMKAIDPSIKIVGPELSWRYQVDGNDPANNWLTPFLRECGDIVDIVGVHRYPFDGRQTIAQSMSDPPLVTVLIDRLRQEIRTVTGKDIPLIFSENNLTWDWNATGDGSGASLYAGVWWADVLGRYMDRNVLMAHHWSTVSDSTLSLFEPDTRKPRPTFYAFDLFSHFFMWRLPSQAGTPDLSVVASRNDGDECISIVAVNRADGDRTFAVQIGGNPAAPFPPESIWVASAWDPLPPRNVRLPRYSMACLQISRDGETRRRWLYSWDQFATDSPPAPGTW